MDFWLLLKMVGQHGRLEEVEERGTGQDRANTTGREKNETWGLWEAVYPAVMVHAGSYPPGSTFSLLRPEQAKLVHETHCR